MRKMILASVCLAFISTLAAQVLYGTAPNGGASGGGTITRLDSTKLTAAFNFDTPDGKYPQFSSFIQASNGKLYAVTMNGGKYGDGIIFSYNTATHVYTRIKDFDYINGAFPVGNLIQGNDGKLYGMTYGGGSSKCGVLYTFDLKTNLYTKLKEFDYTNGAYPYGSLMQAANGKLYGMTSSGGINNKGVLFSYNPITAVYTKLLDFNGDNGHGPIGSLMQASNGKLYGTTEYGGINNGGVIFSYNPVTSVYTKLKDLDDINGSNPQGSLIQAKDGKLYGMTFNGGYNGEGVIFSFTPSTSAYTTIYNFYFVSGSRPRGSLLQAKDGKLYGMTSVGGSINSNNGVIFSFIPAFNEYKVLKNLNPLDGRSPLGGLIQASDIKLYGMTSSGGGGDRGVVFSLDITTSSYTKLRDFGINNTGYTLQGGFAKDDIGMLYGITTYGGVNGSGVIFRFDPSAAVYTKLRDMDYNTGANAQGALMLAKNGKLYGMTYGGGNNNLGVIFSYNPATAIYTKLIDFNGANGSGPYGSLIQAKNGKLYGMTTYGGRDNGGVIFCFDPSTAIYTKLKDLGVTTLAITREAVCYRHLMASCTA